MKSGLEIKIGRYLQADDNISVDIKNIAYHIKRKSFGVAFHLTTYKHNLDMFYKGNSIFLCTI